MEGDASELARCEESLSLAIMAMRRIRTDELYKQAGFASFKDYQNERWKDSCGQAHVDGYRDKRGKWQCRVCRRARQRKREA
jgi:hypothetical protein